MPLHLIRHTRVATPPGLCYGRLDVPLATSFAAEAQAVRHALEQQFPAGLPPLWSSPSQRCQQLARQLGAPVHCDARLQELDFGAWEGRTWAELDSPAARHWGDHWQSAAPPGGESLPELLARLRAVLAELNGADALLVTHAGPIRALHHLLLGEALEHAFQRPVGFGQHLVLAYPCASSLL